ncbi:uncharacterized protein LOC116617734 isoform X2 [Nematostella vectensis]|uniref:uncharacterized protein LOC116617734 isoform X2 n=1 Tax=Nematostella vectensis TaxID=45351 RepID=UPI00207791B3|nr:uncharacterized protein LOC116617734 isoform X2 [Nematostella vectensis]
MTRIEDEREQETARKEKVNKYLADHLISDATSKKGEQNGALSCQWYHFKGRFGLRDVDIHRYSVYFTYVPTDGKLFIDHNLRLWRNFAKMTWRGKLNDVHKKIDDMQMGKNEALSQIEETLKSNAEKERIIGELREKLKDAEPTCPRMCSKEIQTNNQPASNNKGSQCQDFHDLPVRTCEVCTVHTVGLVKSALCEMSAV